MNTDEYRISLFNPCPMSYQPPPVRTQKQGPQIFRQKLLELKSRGISCLQIAYQLGLSRTCVAGWIKEPRDTANDAVINVAYTKFGIPLNAWPAKQSGYRDREETREAAE